MSQTTKRVAFSFSPAVVLAICITLTGPAHGEPIYSQILPAEPVGAFSSLNLSGFQKIGDNFILSGAGPITVRSLRFVGGVTGADASSPPDDFRIVFLDDNSGVPGMSIPGGDYAIGSAFRRTPTGGQLLNGITVPLESVVSQR